MYEQIFIPKDILEKLIDYLERTIVDKAPEKNESIDDIRFKSGQVSVVRLLKNLLKEFNEII